MRDVKWPAMTKGDWRHRAQERAKTLDDTIEVLRAIHPLLEGSVVEQARRVVARVRAIEGEYDALCAELERVQARVAELEAEGNDLSTAYEMARKNREAAEQRAVKAEAQRDRLVEFSENDDCGYCGTRLKDPRTECTECAPIKTIIKEVSG